MHLKDEILRLHLDRALDDQVRQEVTAHLGRCAACQQRLEDLSAQSARAATHLAVLAPGERESARLASTAWRRFQQKEKQPMFKQFLRSPAWVALSIVLVLAVALAFQPVRVLAGNLLGLFRVQQVTLLPMDLTSLKGSYGEPTIAEAMGRMFSDSLVMKREASKRIETSGILETSTTAGFPMRLVYDHDLQQIVLHQGPAFEFTFDPQRAQSILEEFGRSDLVLPPEIDQLLVDVDIPYSITSTYGDCVLMPENHTDDPDGSGFTQKEGCIHLVQMRSPEVIITPDVDPAPLAEIGLRFMGMGERAARQFSRSVDWATTLVIPFPRQDMTAQPVIVDGVEGNLLIETDPGADRLTQYSLIWVKDDILYMLTAMGDPQVGIDLANKLVDQPHQE
jgi:hypothetical protein